MAVDIATLGLEIDVRNAEKAVQLLERLSQAANSAGSASISLGRDTTEASNALVDLQRAASSTSGAVSQTTKPLDGLSRTTREASSSTAALSGETRKLSGTLVALQRGSSSATSALSQAVQRLLGFGKASKQINNELTFIDENLRIIGHSATETGAALARISNSSTASQLNRITNTFRDTGIAINANSRDIRTLTQNMQRLARERAFQSLAQDANMSAVQMARLRLQMGDVAGAFSSIRTGISQHKLAITAAVVSMGLFVKSCIDAQEALNRLNLSYSAVFGADAQNQLKQIYAQADRIGLKFVETAQAAKGFFAAGKGTTLEKDMQGIFKAVTDAGAALQLSTDEVNGALLALGQMISKGKVQAEELRGQLGERLPGAFRLAAEAMGMTTAELDKFMADGKLTAEDLLPKLAIALEEKYGGAAKNAADTVTGAVNRMENEWTRFKARIMNSGPVVFAVKFVTSYIKEGNDAAEKAADDARIDDILRKRGIKPQGTSVSTNTWMSYLGKGVQESFTDVQRDEYRQLEQQAKDIKQHYEDLIQAEEKASADYRSKVTEIIKNSTETKRAAIETQRKELKAAYEEAVKYEKMNPSSKPETLTKLEKEYNSAITELDKKLADLNKKAAGAGKKAASAAKSAAVSQADYTGELERTQNAVESLEKQLGLSKAETLTQAKIKAEQKYQDAISKTNEQLAKQVARGSLTQQQADILRAEKEKEASLQRQLSIKQAEQKQDQKNVQIAQGQIKFYKELGQLSGNYGDSVALQNQLLEQQANKYREEYQLAEEFVQQWLYLQQLQLSQDPLDGATRGLLKFNAEYADSAKQWESLTYNFGKNFMSTTRNMFDDFIDTGKTSFDSLKKLFKQLLKDLAWQAIAQPIMLSVIGGVTGTISGGGNGIAQAGTMASTTAGISSDASGLLSQVASMGGKYALNQFMGGSGGILGGITEAINTSVSGLFPSMFAANQSLAIGNQTINAANAVMSKLGTSATTASLPTTTFTSALGTAGIGAGLGALASPFVNNLLGLQNNTGSQVGSLVGGGLGTLGGAALIGALGATGPVGWLAGGIAALGSLLGGGVGSLFGGGQQELPELYLASGVNLWERYDKDKSGETTYGGEPSFHGNGLFSWGTGAQGTDYWTAYGPVASIFNVLESGQKTANAFEDALRGVDNALGDQFIETLQDMGRITNEVFYEGKDINQENLQNYIDSISTNIQGKIIGALGSVDLTPLTIAADGFAADTAEEVGQAISKILSFASISDVLEDENLKKQFAENYVEQLSQALDNVSLAPLTIAADGLAVDTVEELSSALTDVFAAYDMAESINDEEIKAAYQAKMQSIIEQAFDGIDLSFLRVTFDQNSFAGLQQAYAAIQAWEQVETNIAAVIEPTTEFTSQLTAASSEFDAWISNLRALGWQEDAVSEIEAKRAEYMRKLANNISSEFAQFLNPVSEFDQAMDAASAQFDDWISNLSRLAYTEQEIAQIEARRTEYLQNYQSQLERSMRQDLSLRATAIRYGSSSGNYALQSLLYQQANEREQWKTQYGETHSLYQTGLNVQRAELLSTILDQLKAQRDELMQKEKEATTSRIQKEQKDLAQQQQALQSQINAANTLANTFRRFAQSLEKFRRDLWSGENNLTGSRYSSAYSQFNQLYELAMTGDEEAFGQLESKANELLQLGRNELPEHGEYNDLFYDVDQKLKKAQDYARGQLTEAERQVKLLNAQLDALQAQQDALNAELELLNEQLEAQAEQLEATYECKASIDELNAAISYLEGAIQGPLQTATSSAFDYDRLLAEKAANMNKGLTLGVGQTAGGWTPQKVLEEIRDRGMTVQQWYDLWGRQEGYVLHAAKTTNDTLNYEFGSLDRNLRQNLDDNSYILNGSLTDQLKQLEISGFDLSSLLGTQVANWPQALLKIDTASTNICGAISSMGSSIASAIKYAAAQEEESYQKATKASSSGISSASSTGTSATKTASSTATKTTATSASASKTSSSSTSSSASKTLAAGTATTINIAGRTVSGTATGKGSVNVKASDILAIFNNKYADGGITPANELFLVGEEGPELLMSPKQWGVLDNKQTNAILNYSSAKVPQEHSSMDQLEVAQLEAIRQGIAEISFWLKQLISKADDTAYSNDKIKAILQGMLLTGDTVAK